MLDLIWSRSSRPQLLMMVLSIFTLYIFVKGAEGETAGEPLWTFQTDESLDTVALSSDGRFIATGGSEGIVYFFQQTSKEPLWNYTTNGTVTSVALSVDGQHLVVGSSDFCVYYFDTAFDEPVWSYETDGRVLDVDISASGEHLVAGSRDGTVYGFENSRSYPNSNFSTGDEVLSVAISTDGQYFASGTDGETNNLFFFGWNSWSPDWYFDAKGRVTSMDLSDTGNFLAIGAETRSYLFNTSSNVPLWEFESSYGFEDVALRPTGSQLMASGSSGSDNWTFLLNSTSNDPWQTLNTYHQTKAVALSRFAGEIGYLVTGNGSGHVGLWFHNGSRGAQLLWYDGMGQDVEDVSISDDGRYLVGVNRDGRLNLYYNSHELVKNQRPLAVIEPTAPDHRQFGEPITIHGNGTDADGHILDFFWNSSLQGHLGDSPIITRADLVKGHHNISLQVKDDQGQWSLPVYHELWVYQSFTLELFQPAAFVHPIEGDPGNSTTWLDFQVIATGPDPCYLEALPITLDKTDLDLNLYYEGVSGHHVIWPEENLTVAAGEQLNISVAVTVLGPFVRDVFEVWLAIRDQLEGHEELAVVTLSIDIPELAWMSVSPNRTHQGELVHFNSTGMANGGELISWDWHSTLSGRLANTTNWSSDNLTPGEHIVSLRVQRDDGFWSYSQQFPLSINGRPTSEIKPLKSKMNLVGEPLDLFGLTSDLEQHSLTYRWWSSLTGDFSNELNAIQMQFPVGNHTIYFQATDELGAASEPAWLNITIHAQEPPTPGGREPQPLTSSPLFWFLFLCLLAVSGGFTTLTLSENPRYQFWLLLGPYMARKRERKEDDPLANRIRNLIHSYIQVYPGTHYSQMKDQLSLINGTLAYHLNVLEKERLVESHKRGRLRCYYPRGETPDDLLEPPVSAGQEQIMELIRDHPGISQKRLAHSLGVTGAAIKYHVDGLIQRGKVRRERHGLSVSYFLIKPPGNT